MVIIVWAVGSTESAVCGTASLELLRHGNADDLSSVDFIGRFDEKIVFRPLSSDISAVFETMKLHTRRSPAPGARQAVSGMGRATAVRHADHDHDRIAIQEALDDKAADWLEKVSDFGYGASAKVRPRWKGCASKR